jgi:hypothetical protein
VARSDYYRPSENQIRHHYKCDTCKAEIELMFGDSADTCPCGGTMRFSGESYPANSDEWDEERDTQDGEWHRRR